MSRDVGTQRMAPLPSRVSTSGVRASICQRMRPEYPQNPAEFARSQPPPVPGGGNAM